MGRCFSCRFAPHRQVSDQGKNGSWHTTDIKHRVAVHRATGVAPLLLFSCHPRRPKPPTDNRREQPPETPTPERRPEGALSRRRRTGSELRSCSAP